MSKKSRKQYKIQKWDDRYILLKRKSRWNILGFVVLSVATLGIFNFAEWAMNRDGFSWFMDFEQWTWELIFDFGSTEDAVEAKVKDEESQRSQVIEEYYL